MDLITVDHISKSYGSHHALREVSLNISEQSVFGLLGPNGAGKTTLIRIITQIIAPDQGTVFLRDKPMSMIDVRKIGYLPEERGLYKKMKVGDQLIFLGGLKGLTKHQAKRAAKNWLEKLDAGAWFDKKLEDLSKGMSQKVQFVATVLHNPDLIILDEPFSGFDPVNANLIKDNILELREKGTTVVLSTHRMESVEELCDHVAMIHQNRKILDGTKSEIRRNHKTNIYTIHHDKSISDIEGLSILETREIENELLESQVMMPEGQEPNELLQLLIPQTQVHHFAEKIPSMNEIFIAKLKEAVDHE